MWVGDRKSIQYCLFCLEGAPVVKTKFDRWRRSCRLRSLRRANWSGIFMLSMSTSGSSLWNSW